MTFSKITWKKNVFPKNDSQPNDTQHNISSFLVGIVLSVSFYIKVYFASISKIVIQEKMNGMEQDDNWD